MRSATKFPHTQVGNFTFLQDRNALYCVLSLSEVGNLTGFTDFLVTNKTKETRSLEKSRAWVRLHADKMISSSSQNSKATIPCGISCH